ncbi:cation acetate symporter [Pseudonocardia nematodicida]|uniref:Cation acetate symporter n=1 Tax=Pseudonocardia nematodicida TaxID=1206997 RepID=A0ABV1K5B3_9PSEU
MNASPLTLAVFAGVIALTLGITFWAGRRNTGAGDHYVAGGRLTGSQNGLAITGDLVSAAAFLGTVGLFATQGVSSYFYIVGPFVAFVILLTVLAEPLRNLGRFTMADVVAGRFRSRGVRASMAVNSLLVTIFYMIAQLVAAGALISLLLGVDYAVAVLVVGVLMTAYIAIGGMLATTWIQIVQAVMLLGCMALLVVLILARFGFDPMAMFAAAADSGAKDLFTSPSGLLPGLDLLSLAIAVGLGTAALPHILIRFLTVPDGREARRSMNYALVWIGLSFAAVPVIGYGAVALLGQEAITDAAASGNLATLQVSDLLGGPVLFALVAAVAFAVILATVSGLVIAGSGALAHDLYSSILRRGRATEREQVVAGRAASVAVSLVAIAVSLGAQNTNISVLGVLAVVVAASANIPVLVLLLFWKRLTSAGVIWGIASGVGSAVLLILVGPQVLGDGALFPLTYPSLASVPIGFLGCWLGSVLGGRRHRDDQSSFEEMQVRAALGVTTSGGEAPVDRTTP